MLSPHRGLCCVQLRAHAPLWTLGPEESESQAEPRGAPDTVGKGVRVDGPHMDAELCVWDAGLPGAVLPQQACHAHTFHHRVS